MRYFEGGRGGWVGWEHREGGKGAYKTADPNAVILSLLRYLLSCWCCTRKLSAPGCRQYRDLRDGAWFYGGRGSRGGYRGR